MRTLIQAYRPYQHSLRWEISRQYYQHKGTDVFRLGEVPFSVTSNACLARQLAEVFLAGLQAADYPVDQPIRILELACGFGVLAINFVAAFTQLCEAQGLDYPHRLEYWLSDQAWATLQALAGEEVYRQAPFRLVQMDAAEPLQAKSLAGQTETLPAGYFMGVIANYLYCATPTAFIRHRQGQFAELYNQLFATQTQIHQQELEEHFHWSPIGLDYFPALLQPVIQRFCADLPEAVFAYPIFVLASLERLAYLLAPGGIMLISDKGTVHSDFWAGETLNTPSFHGNSLAHDVNFPLLLQWLTHRGLSGLLTPDSQAALKMLLLCRQSVLPMPVAHAFGTHFCQRNRNLSTQALLAQGVALIAQGQASEGIHLLEQVLQIRPRDGHLIYRLACLYLLQGEPLKALAFKDRPHDSPLLADEFAYLWGESYYALEEYAQACQFYQPLAAKGFPKAQLQAHLQASLRALGRVSEEATQ